MFIPTTVPLLMWPSNTKKFAIGASRAASDLRISCPSIPPTTAQTGENSCAAVVAADLQSVVNLVACKTISGHRTRSSQKEQRRVPVGSRPPRRMQTWQKWPARVQHPCYQGGLRRGSLGTPRFLEGWVGMTVWLHGSAHTKDSKQGSWIEVLGLPLGQIRPSMS